MLKEFDPFDIFDTEAARLDRFFASLDEEGWARQSRCAGWSVRDVLAHLAGEELYNHACLDDDLTGFNTLLDREGVSGYEAFNEWCVRQRRDLPVDEVLAEWRDRNGETRARMRALGADALLETSAGPYPVGLQTFHYDSELATHADDVGAPVSAEEQDGRIWWRVQVGIHVLAETGSDAQVEVEGEQVWVHVNGVTQELTYPLFVEATVGRIPYDHPVDPRVKAALRVLA